MERFRSSTTSSLPWKALWKHSIGTALISREILSAAHPAGDDDTHYLVGLLHNVGKVVMASCFPEELHHLSTLTAGSVAHFAEQEGQLIGWDHARIGAHYLRRHNLAEEIAEAVEYHNEPERAPEHQLLAAAVQVADHLVRHSGVTGGFETVPPIEDGSWQQLSGWTILFGTNESDSILAQQSLAQSLERLPLMLKGLL
jgi:HD-like signal output (HDOD) protein